MKPRSEAQQNASRQNGAKSDGPITPEGKLRSSKNATRYGLRSPQVVLANESEDLYRRYLAIHLAEWNPIGQTETDLLVQMVNARWRIRRIQCMENGTVNTEMFLRKNDFDTTFAPGTPDMRQADAILSLAVANPAGTDYFLRSETRLTRIFTSAKKDLIQLQTMRLGQVPTLQPQELLEPVLPIPILDQAKQPPEDSASSDTNSDTINGTYEPDPEPELGQTNFETPERFSSLSRFIPTSLRPTSDRKTWLNGVLIENPDATA